MTIDIKAIRAAAKEDQKRDNTILLRPSTVLALCDEIERLRVDAARYQWLRDTGWNQAAHPDIWNGEYDAAIDAAMESKT